MKKQKIHFIAPYPKGEAPSQRFRFEQYLDFLEDRDFEIKFHSFHSKASWKRLYLKGHFLQKAIDLFLNLFKRWFLLFQLIPAKHIFIHREMAHIGPPIFEWILAKVMRKKYILDFDDAIWIPNFSSANAKFKHLKCFWKTKYVIQWANKVTAGNAFLVAYAQQYNSNVQLIPTTIDTHNHHTELVNQEVKKVVIGWTGTHSTMHYLDFIIPVIAELEQEYEFEFHIISNMKPDYKLKSLVYKAWNLDTEISDLSQFQIGLMPLIADQWSEGKCGFKALQYMSLGTAAVVSPVGVNSQIVLHAQNGFIANDLADWKKNIQQLIEDHDLRKTIGENARKTIEENWSVEAWKKVYFDLF